MKNQTTKVKIEKAKDGKHVYEYHFFDRKGKEFVEQEPRRYMRVLGKIQTEVVI